MLKLRIVAGLALSLCCTVAWSQCEIEEVVELHEDGLSRSMIKEECGNKVIDAGRCGLSRVISHAVRGRDAAEIYDRCDYVEDDSSGTSSSSNNFPTTQPAFARVCYTNWGNCPMSVALPVGSSCICYTYNGNFPGVAQ